MAKPHPEKPIPHYPRTALATSKSTAPQERSHGNAGVWKAIKPAFHPSHTPWKSLRGFPHYHGYGDDYYVSDIYLKTGKGRRKPAIRAALTARGL
jgi:hypothetical protein